MRTTKMKGSCAWIVFIVICLHLGTATCSWADKNEKNDNSIKAAFREAVTRPSKATARILADGKEVSLATIVGADGYLITKASPLKGKLTCRLHGGRVLAASLVGSNEDYDLALLKVDAEKLTPIVWRSGSVPPPGSLVAAAGLGDVPLAVGVISTEPRRIRGSTNPEGRGGWLGVGLGGGESGLGIASVSPRSAAEKAGLKVDDLVKRIDGQIMKSVEQMVETIGNHAAGDKIKLLVQREDEELELTATLGKMKGGRSPRDGWGGGPFSRRRWGFPSALPHDTVIRPSDCGGPLVDTDGKAVGINIARALRVTTYAIPADTVQQVVAELRRAEGNGQGEE